MFISRRWRERSRAERFEGADPFMWPTSLWCAQIEPLLASGLGHAVLRVVPCHGLLALAGVEAACAHALGRARIAVAHGRKGRGITGANP